MSNPKCPYCGGEMSAVAYGKASLKRSADWVRSNSSEKDTRYCFQCDECEAESPLADTFDEAYATAMKRDRVKGKWIFVLESLLSTTYRCSHCGNYFEEHSNTLNAGRGVLRLVGRIED